MKPGHETAADTFIPVRDITVSAYTIPTSSPESDGTIAWNSTTLVLVEATAGDQTGVGYTYANIATGQVIQSLLKKVVTGMNVMDVPRINRQMIERIRNEGTCGIAMMAVSAVDTALWDLKAKLLNLPLFCLLGKSKEKMLVYGSGGFTSYSNQQLQQQLGDWSAAGMRYVKMKVGRNAAADQERVLQARKAIGSDTELFVDANGGYTVKQAIEKAHQFAAYGISWFEEPVSSDNLQGLQFIRQQVQQGIDIAAGEYGYQLSYFNKMLAAQAVDIIQADATRCGGITGFLKAGHLAEAYDIPFSSHCAPALHLHAALALPSFYIAEYFYDHARIESMLFDGFSPAVNGFMQPDPHRPGLGIDFKHQDAATFKQ
jgi:L-alanine-DL-glutamate epimerase-like enolase superfamily enzyme